MVVTNVAIILNLNCRFWSSRKHKVNSLVLFICYLNVLPGHCKIPVTYIDDDDDVDIYLYLHMVLWEPAMTLLIFIIDAMFN